MLSKPPAAITRLRTGSRIRCEPSGRTISTALDEAVRVEV